MNRAALMEQIWQSLGARQRAWADPRCIDAWLNTALARCDDVDFAQRFAQHCPVAGQPSSAYNHQWLMAPGEPLLLAGIRFKGGDRAAPFVDLLAWGDAIVSRAQWRRVLERVRSHFAPFAPLWMRVRQPGEQAPALPCRLEVDQVLVAGKLKDLTSTPKPECVLTFKRADDLNWLGDFQSAFDGWSRQAGALAREVAPASEDDFKEALETGAVVCAWRDDTWVGVAAAAREDERALRGYVMLEELLAAPARGHGWGVALQRSLIDVLAPRSPDAILWGTIHALNAASQRTALRCGRSVVETWWFADLNAVT